MTTSSPHMLGRLPPELAAMVAGNLDASSLGNVRRSSSRTKAAFTPYLLARIDSSQTFDLSPSGIDRLVCLSECHELKPRIRTLRLVCPFYHTTPDRHWIDVADIHHLYYTAQTAAAHRDLQQVLKTPENQQWVRDALAEHTRIDGAALCDRLAEVLGRFGSLDEVSLETQVVQRPGVRTPPDEVRYLPWRAMWAYALQAFRITLSAVSRSQIRLGSLVIFQTTNVCSVPLDVAAAAFRRARREGFETMAPGLKKFSVSLSTLTHETEDDRSPHDLPPGPEQWSSSLSYPPPDPEPHSPPNHYGLANFYTSLTGPPAADAGDPSEETMRLEDDTSERHSADAHGLDCAGFFHQMTSLESLRVHLFDLYTYAYGARPYSTLLKHILRPAAFPQLESLALHHLPATPSLGSDIRAACPRLRSLDMQYMSLCDPGRVGWCDVLLPLVPGRRSEQDDWSSRDVHLHLLDLFLYPSPGSGLDRDFKCARRTARQMKAKRPETVRLKISDEDMAEAEAEAEPQAREQPGRFFIDVHPDSGVGFDNRMVDGRDLHLMIIRKRRIGPPQ